MSDYTKSTNFASKDSLSSGNPLKIVKGAEIDTEFNNIATAISTKLDSSGGTLTNGIINTPTITGTKETKVAVAASTLDLSTANYFSKTISGTTTFAVSNVPSSGTAISFILDLTNGGSATVNWWSGVKWPGGIVPSLTSSGRDVLGFFTHDGGSTWSGLVLGKDLK